MMTVLGAALLISTAFFLILYVILVRVSRYQTENDSLQAISIRIFRQGSLRNAVILALFLCARYLVCGVI